MIANKQDLSTVEKAIYDAFNDNKPKITWEEHEILYKLIRTIYV